MFNMPSRHRCTADLERLKLLLNLTKETRWLVITAELSRGLPVPLPTNCSGYHCLHRTCFSILVVAFGLDNEMIGIETCRLMTEM